MTNQRRAFPSLSPMLAVALALVAAILLLARMGERASSARGGKPASPKAASIRFELVAENLFVQDWTFHDNRVLAAASLGHIATAGASGDGWRELPVTCPADFTPPGASRPIVEPHPVLDETPAVARTEAGTILLAGGMEHSPDSSILRSDDGARSWSRPAELEAGILLDLVWRDGTGVAVGLAGSIVTARRDGTEWREAVSPTDLDLLALAITGQTAIAVGQQGVVLRSTDSGQTWSGATFGAATLRAIACASGGDVWVGGDAGTILHSTDAGESFSRVSPPASAALARSPAVLCLLVVERKDSHLVLAGLDNGRLLAGDGLGEWTPIPLDPEAGAVLGLLDTGDWILAASESGRIYRAEAPK